MQIDELDVYYVAMPLIYPWRTAYGADYDIHSVLVRARSGDHAAWSESTSFFAPCYLTESAGSVYYHVTEVFGPQVVGHAFDSADALNEKLAIYKGNSFAKAAIEIPQDYRDGLRGMLKREEAELSRFVLEAMLENYEAAEQDRRAMCADTGVPRFFVKAGNEAQIEGGFVEYSVYLEH